MPQPIVCHLNARLPVLGLDGGATVSARAPRRCRPFPVGGLPQRVPAPDPARRRGDSATRPFCRCWPRRGRGVAPDDLRAGPMTAPSPSTAWPASCMCSTSCVSAAGRRPLASTSAPRRCWPWWMGGMASSRPCWRQRALPRQVVREVADHGFEDCASLAAAIAPVPGQGLPGRHRQFRPLLRATSSARGPGARHRQARLLPIGPCRPPGFARRVLAELCAEVRRPAFSSSASPSKAASSQAAMASGVDIFQGYLIGRPAPLCLPSARLRPGAELMPEGRQAEP